MNTTRQLPSHLRNTRRGASLLGYGLMVGLVAVVALGSITTSGSSVNSLFGEVSGSLSSVSAASSASSGGGGSCSAGNQTFTASGTFTPPSGCTSFRVLAVGGGGALDWCYGGSSGQVRTGTFSVSSPVTVTVGAGGVGNPSNNAAQRTGGDSSFGAFLTATGASGANGDGFSTGGRCGSNANPSGQAGDGGSAGGAGQTNSLGEATVGTPGLFDTNYISLFSQVVVSDGAGGTGGGPTSTGSNVGSGGGAGGILLDGSGPSATAGANGPALGGEPGQGYGAGAGGGGIIVSPFAIGVPGTGADGVVYVEWDN